MLAVAAFFALVLSILDVFVCRARRTYAGCGRKTIANLLFALCLTSYALQPARANLIGLVVANAAAVAATILLLEATREYCGRRDSPLTSPVSA